MNIYDRIEGSWSHHDSMRHWMYERMFEVIKGMDFGSEPLRTLEYGSLGIDTPVVRMLRFLRGVTGTISQVAPEYPKPGWDITVSGGYPDSSQDILILDQVMEHVADPWMAVANAHSLLRPGGWLFMTTPFMYPLHDNPIDCWRYTPKGYELLFSKQPWQAIEIGRWGGEQSIIWFLNGNMKRFVPVSEGFSSIPGYAYPDYNTDYPLVSWGIFQKV